MKLKLILLFSAVATMATAQSVTSPDGRLAVSVSTGLYTTYKVTYDGTTVLNPSPLGLVADFGDFSKNLKLINVENDEVSNSYDMTRTKTSHSDYKANRLRCKVKNADGYPMDIVFQVSNNDIAFRYELHKHESQDKETGSIRVMEEKTGFAFVNGATSFVCPQSTAMIGWKRTKPSYEEEYMYDAPLNSIAKFGQGWTFPCLFKSPAPQKPKQTEKSNIWIMISETGVDSHYCASHLSNFDSNTATIAFPMPEENNGNGTIQPAFSLPGATPWRTLTIGDNLAPIVETTIMYDVVKQLYEPSNRYKYGKGTWSWILWQDNSINYEDQLKYIDLAAAMGFQYVLVDNYWDKQIGRMDSPVNGHSIEDVISYAYSKGVDVFLWYSSSGYWNDIVQGPINCMDNSIIRKKEMRWMREQGVKGIKVDFFGGDKQETMRLYEQILSDADDAGLMVIFHGCTIPRGWERMYPNYVGSEAVLASENMYFSMRSCQNEAMDACTHPFLRNAIGAMEWGGCFMNRYMDRDNKSRHARVTTDVFELATTILYQNPIQNFALAPNNLSSLSVEEGKEAGPAPDVCMDFIKQVPTTWSETKLLDGYPGKNVALARKNGSKWYIAAVNAEDQPYKFTLDPAVLGIDPNTLNMYSGGDKPFISSPKIEKGKIIVTIPKNDGVVFVTK